MLGERVGRELIRLTPRGERRRHVGEERVFQNQLGIDDVVAGLGAAERGVINQGSLRVEFLRHHDGLDRRLDLGFLVVTLVDHVGDLRHPTAISGEEVDLVKNPENLIRIDRAESQIVVGVTAVVKVEAAQHVFVQEPGDDLLDVLGVVMVAGVDEDFRAWARLLRQQQRHPPVGDIGGVESGFERFVFDEHRLLRTQLGVECAQGFFETLFARTDAALAGIVRAVGKPQRETIAADRLTDRHGVDAMLERGGANDRVVVTERTPLVALVLEEIGIDGTDLHAVFAREAGDRLRVLTGLEVPLHVNGHRRATTGERMDVTRVGELVVHIDGGGVLEKFPKARARVGKTPRGRFDEEGVEGGAGAAELGRSHGREVNDKEVCVLKRCAWRGADCQA